ASLGLGSSIHALLRFSSFVPLAFFWECSALPRCLLRRYRAQTTVCRLLCKTRLVATPMVCLPGFRSLRALNFPLTGNAILQTVAQPQRLLDLLGCQWLQRR